MMKKLIGIFVCTLMVCSVLVGANSISKNKDGTINVNIPVGTYKITKTGQTHEISVENFGRLLIPSKPNLPSKIFSVAIPPGAKIIDINAYTKDTTLPGSYWILPSTLPRVIGEENPLIYEQEFKKYNENYKSVYGSNNPYPASVAELVGTGCYRKYNLVDVRVNPFTYYPISGKLIYHSVISISVKYTIPEDFSPSNIMIDNLPSTEQTAKEIILNYDQAKNWYPTSPSGRELYDFVIITLDSLTSSVTPLADWESAKGRNVNIVTTSWINSNYNGYDLAAKMRSFLIEKYPSSAWGIIDVCFIGGYDDVPMRRTAQDVGYGQPETDYYYAELSLPDSESWDHNGNHQYGEDSDPIDFQAEINVGRIPWSDPNTVQSICEKSVAYEQNNDESFKKNILLLGAFFWSDTDNAVLMEYKTNPTNYPWMSDWTKTRLYEDAQSSHPCDYDLNYNNVQSVWSTGTYAFVDWAGHGSPDAAYEYYPSQPFVDETTCLSLNNEFPSIIFADSCSNSDTDYLNIGQAMLKQGGVGFLGATKVAFGMPGWNDPYDGSSQSLDCFFTTQVTSGEYTQGAAHQWSLRQMYIDNLWYYTKYEMFEWGSLWGNPDLTMGPVTTSDPPATPSKPTGQTNGIWNVEYTYTSSTTDPDGDQIFYLFDWGDGSNSGWIGPYSSGQTGTGSHIWTVLGTYNVKVKAKDIWGAGSTWSEPLAVTITDNHPPNTPEITGPVEGTPGNPYLYNIITEDLDGNNIYYYVDWGDDTTTGWLGPYVSGTEIHVTHSWATEGNYTIKAKAKDSMDAESAWGYIDIVIPVDVSIGSATQQLFFQSMLLSQRLNT